jgi:hypothetical protein
MTPRRPKTETRESIERALHAKRYRQEIARRVRGFDIQHHLAKLRGLLDPASFAKVQSQFLRGSYKLSVQIRRNRRPRDGSMPALVEPRRGPNPLIGGAAAPLEFD